MRSTDVKIFNNLNETLPKWLDYLDFTILVHFFIRSYPIDILLSTGNTMSTKD